MTRQQKRDYKRERERTFTHHSLYDVHSINGGFKLEPFADHRRSAMAWKHKRR